MKGRKMPLLNMLRDSNWWTASEKTFQTSASKLRNKLGHFNASCQGKHTLL